MHLPARMQAIAESRRFNLFIVSLIVLTSVLIGLDTYPPIKSRFGFLFETVDKIILGIFVIEQVIRLLAEGKKPWRYFTNPWNLFDFFIITACLLPFNQSSVAIVRLVRILRILRLVKAVPALRVIVQGMIKSLSSIGYVAIMLSVVFYLFSVLGVSFFSIDAPERFGSLQAALLSLFQVLTLENWPDVMEPIKQIHPIGGPAFFISFIIIGTMISLNLFVGVIVGGMSDAAGEIKAEKGGKSVTESGLEATVRKLAALEGELGEIRKTLADETERLRKG